MDRARENTQYTYNNYSHSGLPSMQKILAIKLFC